MSKDPTSVVMTLSDGRVVEEAFATRFQAELFMASLPFVAWPEDGRVVEAILSPLAILSPRVESGPGEVSCG